jgi:hexosaminidase
VLLEVDLPGHTASLHASHPEHIASYNAQPYGKYANQPPAGQIRFATDATVKWTRNLVRDVVGLVGADGSRYVGTGGDEVNVPCMVSPAFAYNASELIFTDG